MRARLSLFLACLLLGLLPLRAGAEVAVDLELVLAVDASGSVNQKEWALQLGGIADAFLDERIQGAVASGPRGRIAVALLLWSDASFPKFASDWFVLEGADTAEAFAAEVDSYIERRAATIGSAGAGTGIGAALDHAVGMFAGNGIAAPRQTVDISGDGVETKPWFQQAIDLPVARSIAASSGVVVNGLAILTDYEDLGTYYREELITGPGSFVLEAAGFDDFAEAMKKKLLAEILAVVGEGGAPAASAQPILRTRAE